VNTLQSLDKVNIRHNSNQKKSRYYLHLKFLFICAWNFNYKSKKIKMNCVSWIYNLGLVYLGTRNLITMDSNASKLLALYNQQWYPLIPAVTTSTVLWLQWHVTVLFAVRFCGMVYWYIQHDTLSWHWALQRHSFLSVE